MIEYIPSDAIELHWCITCILELSIVSSTPSTNLWIHNILASFLRSRCLNTSREVYQDSLHWDRSYEIDTVLIIVKYMLHSCYIIITLWTDWVIAVTMKYVSVIIIPELCHYYDISSVHCDGMICDDMVGFSHWLWSMYAIIVNVTSYIYISDISNQFNLWILP